MRRGIPARRSRAADWARLLGGLALPVLVARGRAARGSDWCRRPRSRRCSSRASRSVSSRWRSPSIRSPTSGTPAPKARVPRSPASSMPRRRCVVLGVVAAAAVVYPQLTDVATDLDDPPLFTALRRTAGKLDAAAVHAAAERLPGDRVARLPGDPRRRLPRGAAHLRTAAWAVLRDVHAPDLAGSVEGAQPTQAVSEDDEVALALSLKSVMTQSRTGAATEIQRRLRSRRRRPAADGAPPENEAAIEARGRLRWSSDFPTTSWCGCGRRRGTRVDMRSASRAGKHDLGQNARRIKQLPRRSRFSASAGSRRDAARGAVVASARGVGERRRVVRLPVRARRDPRDARASKARRRRRASGRGRVDARDRSRGSCGRPPQALQDRRLAHPAGAPASPRT